MKNTKRAIEIILILSIVVMLCFQSFAVGATAVDVRNIEGTNVLLVGDYAFNLNESENVSNYNLNNFLTAASTVYRNAGSNHAYVKIGENTDSHWYDIVADPTMIAPITTVSSINGSGMYKYMNMKMPVTTMAGISGLAGVGHVLTAGVMTPPQATVNYKWQKSDTANGTYTDIQGAVANTYPLSTLDIGKFIRVVATGTGEYTGKLTSNPTSAVLEHQSFISVTDETNTLTSEKMPIGGKNLQVGKFRLYAPDDEKIIISGIKITNFGSAESSKIYSVALYNGITQIGEAPVSQMINFTEPIEIEAANSLVLTVKLNTATDLESDDTFQAQIEDSWDLVATSDNFGSAMKFSNNGTNGTVWRSHSQYIASRAEVEVASIAASQSSTILKGASNFKLGKVYISNNNVEDVKLSTLKLNLQVTSSAALTLGANTIKNIRLLSSLGTILATKSNISISELIPPTNDRNSTKGTSTLNNEYDLDFELSSEYLIPKSTQVSFDVMCDLPTPSNEDIGKKISILFFQPGTGQSLSNLSATGQSSGETLYAINQAIPIKGSSVEIISSLGQKISLFKDINFDNTSGTSLAVGEGRIVANWKIKDGSLNEDANVKKITLVNAPSISTLTPDAFRLTNFDLFYDGVKYATAYSMQWNNEIVFGNGDSTLFTVKDGEVGKKLVVKANIDTDTPKGRLVDIRLTDASKFEAKGVSTGEEINADESSLTESQGVALEHDKEIKGRYATFEKISNTSGSVPAGGKVEVLRFKLTPQSGKMLNLKDLSFILNDKFASTLNERVSVMDITTGNPEPVTLVNDTSFNANEAIVAFNDNNYSSVSEEKIFSVRIDTFDIADTKSYQIGISYIGDHLQIAAPTEDSNNGFAAVGESIVGDVITATK